jgi:hypothetical protein
MWEKTQYLYGRIFSTFGDAKKCEYFVAWIWWILQKINFRETLNFLLEYLITMLCKNLEKYANILWLQKTILLQLKNHLKSSVVTTNPADAVGLFTLIACSLLVRMIVQLLVHCLFSWLFRSLFIACCQNRSRVSVIATSEYVGVPMFWGRKGLWYEYWGKAPYARGWYLCYYVYFANPNTIRVNEWSGQNSELRTLSGVSRPRDPKACSVFRSTRGLTWRDAQVLGYFGVRYESNEELTIVSRGFWFAILGPEVQWAQEELMSNSKGDRMTID